MTVQILTVQIN